MKKINQITPTHLTYTRIHIISYTLYIHTSLYLYLIVHGARNWGSSPPEIFLAARIGWRYFFFTTFPLSLLSLSLLSLRHSLGGGSHTMLGRRGICARLTYKETKGPPAALSLSLWRCKVFEVPWGHINWPTHNKRSGLHPHLLHRPGVVASRNGREVAIRELDRRASDRGLPTPCEVGFTFCRVERRFVLGSDR
jgi:hypothetical protein